MTGKGRAGDTRVLEVGLKKLIQKKPLVLSKAAFICDKHNKTISNLI